MPPSVCVCVCVCAHHAKQGVSSKLNRMSSFSQSGDGGFKRWDKDTQPREIYSCVKARTSTHVIAPAWKGCVCIRWTTYLSLLVSFSRLASSSSLTNTHMRFMLTVNWLSIKYLLITTTILIDNVELDRSSEIKWNNIIRQHNSCFMQELTWAWGLLYAFIISVTWHKPAASKHHQHSRQS